MQWTNANVQLNLRNSLFILFYINRNTTFYYHYSRRRVEYLINYLKDNQTNGQIPPKMHFLMCFQISSFAIRKILNIVRFFNSVIFF